MKKVINVERFSHLCSEGWTQRATSADLKGLVMGRRYFSSSPHRMKVVPYGITLFGIV